MWGEKLSSQCHIVWLYGCMPQTLETGFGPKCRHQGQNTTIQIYIFENSKVTNLKSSVGYNQEDICIDAHESKTVLATIIIHFQSVSQTRETLLENSRWKDRGEQKDLNTLGGRTSLDTHVKHTRVNTKTRREQWTFKIKEETLEISTKINVVTEKLE